MSHELTFEELASFSKAFNEDDRQQVVGRAAQRVGLYEASFNERVRTNLTTVFSTQLKTDKVTAQQRSGRCWLFATLNVLRHNFGKKYNVKNFELSQTYNFFWDKIERANIFYDKMIELADKPLDDREVKAYLDFAGHDGGRWQMAVSLVEKYGVVPNYVMPDTFNTAHTEALDLVLADKERKDALELRKLAHEPEAVEKARQKFLSEIYRIIATAIGEPPTSFDLQYRDDDDKYHFAGNLTPQDFLKEYFDIDFTDYVVVDNAPDHELNKLYSLPFEENVRGKYPIYSINAPMEALEKASIAQLKDGEAVWFGNDVLRQMDRQTGYLDTELYKFNDLFNLDLSMSKADRLSTGAAEMSHAMALVGVDEADGAVRKWKVENSWSDKAGQKGYFIMSHEWFNDYVYEVVVHKRYLDQKYLDLLETEPTLLKPWDSLA